MVSFLSQCDDPSASLVSAISISGGFSMMGDRVYPLSILSVDVARDAGVNYEVRSQGP